MYQEIRDVDTEMHYKSLSVDVFLREIIQIYQLDNNYEGNNKLIRNYCSLIEQGYPFEVIDGDHFYFAEKFLQDLASNISQNSRVFVISILGPQNSGKSTLLNFLFGCLFAVSDGRCTRGVYGTYMKSMLPQYDYFLILDTEGLQSVEKGDPHYDRQITLFCLAVSHLIIINVKDQINDSLKQILEVCADSLRQMQTQKISKPHLFIVLNQRVDTNSTQDLDAIFRILRDFQRNDLSSLLSIKKDNFILLPSAFDRTTIMIDANTQWKVFKTSQDFTDKIHELASQIFKKINQPLDDNNNNNFTDFSSWMSLAKDCFGIIVKYPDLTYFKDIQEKNSNIRIQQWIKGELDKVLSTEKEKEFFMSMNQYEDTTIELGIRKKFENLRNELGEQLENKFKVFGASNIVRKMNREYLSNQIENASFQWIQKCQLNSYQERMRRLVQNGDFILRQKAKELARSGKVIREIQAEEIFEESWKDIITGAQTKFQQNDLEKWSLSYVYFTYSSLENTLRDSKFLMEFENAYKNPGMKQNFSNSWFCTDEQLLQQAIDNEKTNILKSYQSIDKYPWVFFNREYLTNNIYKSIEEQIGNGIECLNKIGPKDQLILQKELSQYGLTLNENWSKFIKGNNTFECTPLIFKVKQIVNVQRSQVREKQKGYQSSELWYPFSDTIKKLVTEKVEIVRLINIQKPFDLIEEALKEVGSRPVDRQQVMQMNLFIREKVIKTFNQDLMNFGLTLTIEAKNDFHFLVISQLHRLNLEIMRNILLAPLQELNSKKDNLKRFFLTQLFPTQNSYETAQRISQIIIDLLTKKALKHSQNEFISKVRDFSKINSRIPLQKKIDMDLPYQSNEIKYQYIKQPLELIIQKFNEYWKQEEQSIVTHCSTEYKKFHQILQGIRQRALNLQQALKNLNPNSEYDSDDIFEVDSGDINMNSSLKRFAALLYVHSYICGKPATEFEIEDQLVIPKIDLPTDTLILSHDETEFLMEVQNYFEDTQIINLDGFLQNFVNELQQCQNIFINQSVNECSLEKLDANFTLKQLRDSLIICRACCPCCGRPCDTDHNQDINNKFIHKCQLGHQLRAFNGYKLEYENEAAIRFCYDMNNEDLILSKGKWYTWTEFKQMHDDWDFDFTATDKEHETQMRGKFYSVWTSIGYKFCQEYGMKYVEANTKIINNQIDVPPFLHYILCLDASGSMEDQWDSLMNCVQEFLEIREKFNFEKNREDRVSIVVFSHYANIEVYNELPHPSLVNKLTFYRGNTSFIKAFKEVHKIMKNSESLQNQEKGKFFIVFMSDGDAIDPSEVVYDILQECGEKIHQSWVVPFGYGAALESVKECLQAKLRKANDEIELKAAFREIARE